MVRGLEQISLVVKTINSMLSHRSVDSEGVSIIESDFEHEKYKDQLDSRNPRMNRYGVFTGQEELQQFQAVKQQLLGKLHRACAKNLSCVLDVSTEQVNRLAQDVLRMSHCEPCGVRGAVIFVVLERKDLCEKLVTIQGDASTLPTFELYVTLKEDTSRWKAFKRAYLTLKECFLNGAWKEAPIVLCSGYQLEKKRLYRPNPAL